MKYVAILLLLVVTMATAMSSALPSNDAKSLSPSSDASNNDRFVQVTVKKPFISVQNYIDEALKIPKFAVFAVSAGTKYTSITAAKAHANTHILYVIQKQTPVTFAGKAAADGLAIYIGETIQTFKQRYSSYSKASTGLQAVIDSFGATDVQVTIYDITSGNKKFDESVAAELVAEIAKKTAALANICVGNIRGMAWGKQSAAVQDIQCM